jgi:hypothetical protein
VRKPRRTLSNGLETANQKETRQTYTRPEKRNQSHSPETLDANSAGNECLEARILRSDQPRGWANVAIDAIPKITGKITRQ